MTFLLFIMSSAYWLMMLTYKADLVLTFHNYCYYEFTVIRCIAIISETWKYLSIWVASFSSVNRIKKKLNFSYQWLSNLFLILFASDNNVNIFKFNWSFFFLSVTLETLYSLSQDVHIWMLTFYRLEDLLVFSYHMIVMLIIVICFS